jgi:hypothetical protein
MGATHGRQLIASVIAGTATAIGPAVSFSNGSGVSFGITGNTVTASVAAGGGVTQATMYATGNTTQSSTGTQALSSLIFRGAGDLSMGITGGSVVASVPSGLLTSQSNQAVSADASFTFQTLSFSNANGFSFGTSAGPAITGSYTVPTVTNSSWTVSDAATSQTVVRLAFTNLNGVTLSLSTGVLGRHTIVGSHNGITSQSNQQITLLATGNTTQSSTGTTNASSIIFRGAGDASVGVTAGSIVVSIPSGVLTSQSNQAFSAAGGSSAFQTLGFSDNAAGSFTNTNGSVAIASVRASLFAVSNTTQSSSGTQNLGNLSFAGAGIASVGVTNGSVVVSVPAGGGGGDGGVFAGVSTMGNTAGSTGTVSTGNFVLVGSGPISLSQSTGAAGSAATITINGPATSSLSATGAVSISTNGSTISIGAPADATVPGYHPYDDFVQAVGQVGQGTLQFDPQVFPNVSLDRVGVFIQNTNSSNSSGSHTLSFWIGLYTRNAASLSLYTSFSGSTAVTHSGTAGSYSLYSGGRLFTFSAAAMSVPANKYWIGFVSRTTSGGTNGTYSNWMVSNIASQFTGVFGVASNATMQPKLGQGYYTATTAGLPSSVAFSEINGTNSGARRMPIVQFHSSTA